MVLIGGEEIVRHWEKILDAMDPGVMLVDNKGFIVMVNQAFSRMSGYSKDEITGKRCSVLSCDICGLARTKTSRGWCILFHEGQIRVKYCQIKTKGGARLAAVKNGRLLKDSTGQILGAVETFTDLSELYRRDAKIEELSRMLDAQPGYCGMIGESKAMRNLFQIIEKAAMSDAPVVIYGETGTGKELTAQAIHRMGKRSAGPYLQLSCATLNESLLESELFGHKKGAFTGAVHDHKGRFEVADGGDIFLDEIGEISPAVQVKLLRILETGQFERVGDNTPLSADVRIISATNRDLKDLVQRKGFREDLYFRINVIPIFLPPLRERVDDIPLLVNHFVRRLRERYGKDIRGVTPESMKALMTYEWPGNVRQLKSTMEYAFAVCDKGLILPEQLSMDLLERAHENEMEKTHENVEADLSLTNKEEAEKNALLEALKKCRGHQAKTAELLGVSRVTVWHRMKKYGIDLKRTLSSI